MLWVKLTAVPTNGNGDVVAGNLFYVETNPVGGDFLNIFLDFDDTNGR